MVPSCRVSFVREQGVEVGAARLLPSSLGSWRVAGGLPVEVSCGSGERAERGWDEPVCGVESGPPVGVCQLSVGEGWCLASADAELLREAHDAPGSASAHTVETDFGALNVTSIPPPLPPPAPSGRRNLPVPGATLHQRDEVPAGHRTGRVNREPVEGLGVGEPAARSLGELPVGGQVVVAALGRDGLGLQIPGVAATLGGTDARRAHHTG